MHRTTRITPARLLVAALVALVAAWAAAQPAHGGPEAPEVPAAIQVEEGHKPFLVTHAVGVQIYECRAGAEGYAWAFVAPRASLYADNGKLVATHFGGPTWQARDGSSVVAAVAGRAPAAGTIPWLLLAATSTSAGADGERLAGTSFVQRLATTGGLAPAAETCGAASAGGIHESPYTADYAFWKPTGS